MKTALAAIALALAGATAQANTLANDMTCAEAQAYYQEHGHVWVETRMGDVVPVYGDRKECTAGEEKHPVWVRTTDTDTCEIAFVCRPNDNH